MTILCYHAVQERWDSPLAVTPQTFAQQAAWLRRTRTVLPIHEALTRLDRSGRLPRRTAALTFDDGFSDMYTEALPVLVRERLPATMFLVAQTLTSDGQAVDWVDDPGAEPLTTLTIDQVLEMQSAGVDFQSHSWAHHDLTSLPFEDCVRDLKDSREFLSDLLGRRVTLLAYPRGLHDQQVREAAERAGYTHAFALPVSPEQPTRFAVPRVGIWRSNGPLAVRVKASRPYVRLRTSGTIAQTVVGAKGVVRTLRASRR